MTAKKLIRRAFWCSFTATWLVFPHLDFLPKRYVSPAEITGCFLYLVAMVYLLSIGPLMIEKKIKWDTE